MIETETIYYMRCNKCWKYMEGWDDTPYPYSNYKTAVSDAEKSGWLCLKNNIHYCNDCRKEIKNER